MQRTHVLAFTAALIALAAADRSDGVSQNGDSCRQIAGPRPDTAGDRDSAANASWRRSFARGTEYRCVIHETLPAVRLTLFGDAPDMTLDSIVVVPESASPVPRQTPSFYGELPDRWDRSGVRMIDLDADGYDDLLVAKWRGATGNTGYEVWRFDARTLRFVDDSVLSEESNPEPVPGRACVRTHSNTSWADGEAALRCLRNGRWIVDTAETDRWDRAAHVIVHETRARRGDSLVVVRRTTRPDSTDEAR